MEGLQSPPGSLSQVSRQSERDRAANTNSFYVPLSIQSYPCPYCGVKRFQEEKSTFCCSGGKYVVPHDLIPSIPTVLSPLYKHASFSLESRKLNNLHSFASVGTSPSREDGGGFMHYEGGLPSFVVVQGRIIHRIIPADQVTSPLHWYIHDASHDRSSLYENLNMTLPLPLLQKFSWFMKNVNMYGQLLCNMGEFMLQQHQPCQLSVSYDVEARDVSCAYRSFDDTSPPARCGVVFLSSTLQERQPRLTFINSLNPLYESLSYPVINPCAIPGYDVQNKVRAAATARYPRPLEISRMWFYRQMLLRSLPLQHAGRLMNEWLCDMFSITETERLQNLRLSSIQESAALFRYNNEAAVILPASFKNSKREKKLLVEDALTICGFYGRADFFITMTTNPNWPEITDNVLPGQTAYDRPDITARVFHCKMAQLLSDLRDGSLLLHKQSQLLYIFTVVEFQLRGLPHTHIVLKYADSSPVQDIDSIISAELPATIDIHSQEQSVYRAAVLKWMTHSHILSSPCMAGRPNAASICKKYFPKPLAEHSTFSPQGYPIYRRRKAEDTFVVPHSKNLLLKYDCHINVELASEVSLIAYLYKYIYKGPDRSGVHLRTESNSDPSSASAVDEISEYMKMRILSAPEAAWRLLGFHTSKRTPSVMRLDVFTRDELSGPRTSFTTLDLFYGRADVHKLLDYKTYFYNYTVKTKQPRRQNFITDKLGNYVVSNESQLPTARKVPRIHSVPVGCGERFYKKLLLEHNSAGAVSDFDLRVVGGIVYSSFQQAAATAGLTLGSSEYALAMEQAVRTFHTPDMLRRLFCLCIRNGGLAVELYEHFKHHMGRDIAIRFNVDKLNAANEFDFNNLPSTMHPRAENELLLTFQLLLEREDLSSFGLPSPVVAESRKDREIVWHSLAFDASVLRQELLSLIPTLNEEQRTIFNEVHECIITHKQVLMVVKARSGRGKTYLLNTVSKMVRARREICLTCSSTAISALMIPNSTTAHTLFRIPVVRDGDGPVECDVSSDSERAALLRVASLFIWDEFACMHRDCIEAVHILLQQLMGNNLPFGGKSILLSGDFRQTAPVVPGGDKVDILYYSFRFSALYSSFFIRELTRPMRDASDPAYSAQVDQIGDGVDHLGQPLPSTHVLSLSTPFACTFFTDFIQAMNWAYPSPRCSTHPPDQFTTVLSVRNSEVREINDYYVDTFFPDAPTFTAQNYLKDTTDGHTFDIPSVMAEEYLNSLEVSGVPPQRLRLFPGAHAVVLRNMYMDIQCVNGAKVTITRIHSPYLIEVYIHSSNSTVSLPRILFSFQLPSVPLEVHRRQFPLCLAYSLTVNKSQSQTLSRVLLDLRTPVFAHGQLYVAFGRVASSSSIAVLIQEKTKGRDKDNITNVVYQELLH